MCGEPPFPLPPSMYTVAHVRTCTPIALARTLSLSVFLSRRVAAAALFFSAVYISLRARAPGSSPTYSSSAECARVLYRLLGRSLEHTRTRRRQCRLSPRERISLQSARTRCIRRLAGIVKEPWESFLWQERERDDCEVRQGYSRILLREKRVNFAGAAGRFGG